jgi:hypothetical protein
LDTTELIDRYCEVWCEPDEDRRRMLLEHVWAEDASYTDPTVLAVGADELLTHISGVRQRRPGSRVVRTSAVDVHHDLARFAWRAIDSSGNALREGIDVAFFSADGSRIARIIGFFGPLQPDAG